MARSRAELFDTFVARVAELLRDELELEPGPLLHVHADSFTIEGRIRETQDGGAEWLAFVAMPERLEWEGPERLAQGFVHEYEARRSAAR